MKLLRTIEALWLIRGARLDRRESERLRRLADAHLARSLARADLAHAMIAANRAAPTLGA